MKDLEIFDKNGKALHIADIKNRSFSYNDMYEAIKFAIWNEENYANEKGIINIDDVIHDAVKYAVDPQEVF